MSHSQRIRSGAALRATLSSGSSDHIKSWFITTLQDSNLYYTHHNFPYPSQKNSSMEPPILPTANSLAAFKAANPMQRQNRQILFLLSTYRAKKNHRQVKIINISVKTLPFSESQDNTGKVLKEFRQKYFIKTKGKWKSLAQINKRSSRNKTLECVLAQEKPDFQNQISKPFEAKHGYEAEPLAYLWN